MLIKPFIIDINLNSNIKNHYNIIVLSLSNRLLIILVLRASPAWCTPNVSQLKSLSAGDAGGWSLKHRFWRVSRGPSGSGSRELWPLPPRPRRVAQSGKRCRRKTKKKNNKKDFQFLIFSPERVSWKQSVRTGKEQQNLVASRKLIAGLSC